MQVELVPCVRTLLKFRIKNLPYIIIQFSIGSSSKVGHSVWDIQCKCDIINKSDRFNKLLVAFLFVVSNILSPTFTWIGLSYFDTIENIQYSYECKFLFDYFKRRNLFNNLSVSSLIQ